MSSILMMNSPGIKMTRDHADICRSHVGTRYGVTRSHGSSQEAKFRVGLDHSVAGKREDSHWNVGATLQLDHMIPEIFQQVDHSLCLIILQS